MRLAHRENWLRETDRVDLQSRAAQLHFDKVAVGEDARAGDLREDPPHHVSERLCSLPVDRRVRDRRAGGKRHVAAGCDASTVVKGSGRGSGYSGKLVAESVRVT